MQGTIDGERIVQFGKGGQKAFIENSTWIAGCISFSFDPIS
jgi:hypothetical protein